MNDFRVLLYASAGTRAIDFLFALLVLGPLPVPPGQLAQACKSDEATAKRALGILEGMGLALRTGSVKRAQGWLLTQAAKELLCGCFQLASRIQTAGCLPQPLPLFDDPGPGFLPNAPYPNFSDKEPPVVVVKESIVNTESSTTPPAPYPNFSDKDLPNLTAALEAANILPHLIPGMRNAMQAENAYLWTRSVLGWICYFVRNGARTPRQLGARVHGVLRHSPPQFERQHAPADCLPPEDLDFAAAVAWAKRGGRAEIPEFDDPQESSLPGEAPKEQGADARLWSSALAKLKMEMPKETFDTWVANTVLLRCSNGEYVIGVPCTYAREWLSNRLSATVMRILGLTTGALVVSVTFEVMP